MPSRPRIPDWLPPLALPLAMLIAMLALGGDRGYFYRDGGIHGWNASKALAIAENLSPEHNFRLAHRIRQDADGGFRYNFYSRFPVGGYVLIKMATMPFGGDLAAKLMAAVVLMLLMFCAAALLAYLALARITRSRWTALAATLLAFSGLYALYYADGVFNEGVMDMFGAALAFHGMTVFVQEGRFRQLLVKTCAALLIGWHVYALLLPFIAIGFGGEALALIRAAVSSNEKAKAARTALISLARSRYAALAAVSIIFGASLLAFNFANEYTVRGEGGTLSETPSFRSMVGRLGIGTWETDWYALFERQFYRVGVSSAPYALARAAGYDFPIEEPYVPPFAVTAFGAAATLAALAALAFVRRYRILAATAILFGFCWAIPVRHNAYNLNHVFEALPYTALTLALFTLALIAARRRMGEPRGSRIAIAAAILAAPIFALSVFLAGQIDRDPYQAERDKSIMADFSAVMEIARGKRVRLVWHPDVWTDQRHWSAPGRDWGFWYRYYLAGSYPTSNANCSRAADADFTVARYLDARLNPLTPENRFAFLYGKTAPLDLCRAERRRLERSQPAARAVWDVYIQDDSISYLKAPCAPRDYEAPFYAYAYPANPNDLPPKHKADGFHPTENAVDFARVGATFDDACLMTLHLPDYPIAAVQTGQWIPGVERLWTVFAIPPPTAETLAIYEKTYQAITASGPPAARSGFDLYIDRDRNTLSYLKELCAESDARGRIFLSVHPVDMEDLPPDRREIGHASLNFDVAPPHVAIFNGKCMSTRQLPDYDIKKIETGQWIPGGEGLWDATIVVSD